MNQIIKDEGDKKSIDVGESVSGLIDFIRRLFEKKGIILSQRAYASLYLGIWSIFLIWLVSKKPLWDESYIIAYGLIIYFLSHFIWNWTWLQNVTIRLLNKSDYEIKLMQENKIAYSKFAPIIERYATSNPEKIIQTIEGLINKRKFNEEIQFALFNKYNRTSLPLVEYIESLFLKSKIITNSALAYYLSITDIEEDLLQKIVASYRTYPSFLFNLGRFQFYKFEDGSIEKKYYNAGYNFSRFREKTYQYRSVVIVLLALVVIATNLWFITTRPISIPLWTVFFCLTLLALALSMSPLDTIKSWIEKKKVNELLSKEQIKLEESELEKFVNELNL